MEKGRKIQRKSINTLSTSNLKQTSLTGRRARATNRTDRHKPGMTAVKRLETAMMMEKAAATTILALGSIRCNMDSPAIKSSLIIFFFDEGISEKLL